MGRKKGSSIVSLDVDQVCDRIVEGCSLTQIATAEGCGIATLIRWIEGDKERSARIREARIRSAFLWEQKAEQALLEASNPFELTKARDLAHHYRWRASKIAPREFGDKIQTEHSGEIGVKKASEMTDDEIAAFLTRKR